MKHRSKRALGVLLSLVLALVMLVGLFPAAALAEAPNDEPETGYDTQLDTKPGDDPEDPLPPQTLGEGDDTALTKGGAAVPEDEPLSETEESGKALYYAKNGTIEENDLDMKALSGPVSYLDENNSSAECNDYTVVAGDTTAWSSGWYVVDEDVTIDGRITVDGDVFLILCDSATLTANAGITVEGNNSLTIYAQSTGDYMGTLIATGAGDEYGPYPAGIGGYENAGGTLTINGGNVTATGYSAEYGGGAGIGGCVAEGNGYVHGFLGTDLTINGGNVTATGGYYSPGIGDGAMCDGDSVSSVTINGGNVAATGGDYGAGIGGGGYGHGVDVTITGGTVEATGGTAAAGIGEGAEYNENVDFTVTVNGGTVTASGGDADEDFGLCNGAGIGGGGTGASKPANRGTLSGFSNVTIKAGGKPNPTAEWPFENTPIFGSQDGFKEYHWYQYVILESAAPTVPVTGVTLDKTETQTVFVDGTVSFTATVEPDSATDKTVKWSVGGNDTGAVKLYSDATCTTEVGTDATDTMTVYAKGISAGSASVIVTSNADSTKTATCAVTVTEASAIFEGGGLRRRVLTGTRTAVNTSTDLRLVFIYALPEGAAFVSDESAEDYSYILWDTGSGALNNKVTAKKTFEEGGKTKCALVITRVPNTAFSSSIHAQLHLVYTLNEQTYSVDSDVGSRSVNDICTTLKSRTDTWADYAKFLLGEIDSYEIPA